MEIEEYLIEDATEIIAEGDDTWREKITELGLEGQLTLMDVCNKRIPFPVMNRIELAVYEELLDTQILLEKYAHEPLPLRVLSLIALCRQEEYFESLQVWYNPQIKDPILVGLAKDPTSTWAKTRYLIARWGEELLDMPTLTAMAEKKWKARKRSEWTKKIADHQAAIERLDTDAAARFQGVVITEPY